MTSESADIEPRVVAVPPEGHVDFSYRHSEPEPVFETAEACEHCQHEPHWELFEAASMSTGGVSGSVSRRWYYCKRYPECLCSVEPCEACNMVAGWIVQPHWMQACRNCGHIQRATVYA